MRDQLQCGREYRLRKRRFPYPRSRVFCRPVRDVSELGLHPVSRSRLIRALAPGKTRQLLPSVCIKGTLMMCVDRGLHKHFLWRDAQNINDRRVSYAQTRLLSTSAKRSLRRAFVGLRCAVRYCQRARQYWLRRKEHLLQFDRKFAARRGNTAPPPAVNCAPRLQWRGTALPDLPLFKGRRNRHQCH